MIEKLADIFFKEPFTVVPVIIVFIFIIMRLIMKSCEQIRELLNHFSYIHWGITVLLVIEVTILQDLYSISLDNPLIVKQLIMYISSMLATIFIIYMFSKRKNHSEYSRVMTVILGILQVAISMETTDNNFIYFNLSLTSNIIYLTLPALFLYEIQKRENINDTKIRNGRPF